MTRVRPGTQFIGTTWDGYPASAAYVLLSRRPV